MKLAFRNTTKDSLNAHFDILRMGQLVGTVDWHNWFPTPDGALQAICFGQHIELAYGQSKGKSVLNDPNRVYTLAIDGQMCGQVSWEIFLGDVVKCIHVRFYDRTFMVHPYPLGKDGFSYPVYENNRQVIDIRKGCWVKNDLHDFDVAMVDEPGMAVVSTICTGYIFCKSWWRSGPQRKAYKEKFIQSGRRSGKNQSLSGLAPFDAEFFNRMTD